MEQRQCDHELSGAFGTFLAPALGLFWAATRVPEFHQSEPISAGSIVVAVILAVFLKEIV